MNIDRKSICSVAFAFIGFLVLIALSSFIYSMSAYADDIMNSESTMKTVRSNPGTWQYIPVLSQDATDNPGGVSRDMSFRVLLSDDIAPAGSSVYAKMKYEGFDKVSKTDDYTGFHLWGTFVLVVDGKEVFDKELTDAKAVFHRVPISADNAKNDSARGVSNLSYVTSEQSYYVFLSNGDSDKRRYTASGDPITFKPTIHNVNGASARFEIYAGAKIEKKNNDSSSNSMFDMMYRLYNSNSGEHFYTAKTTERDNLVKAGWKYEGVAWKAPKVSKTAVYRLYSGTDHHYTTSVAERDALVRSGWKYEGIGWYSDDARGVALYRVYNPNVNPNANTNNSGSHHYTMSRIEADSLVGKGWKNEGVGWYGCK